MTLAAATPGPWPLVVLGLMVVLGVVGIVIANPKRIEDVEYPDAEAIADGLAIENDDPRLPYGGGFGG